MKATELSIKRARAIQGGTLVQVALFVAILMGGIILPVYSLSVLFYRKVVMQFVAAQVARSVNLGTINYSGSGINSAALTQNEIRSSIISKAQTFGVSLQNNNISICDKLLGPNNCATQCTTQPVGACNEGYRPIAGDGVDGRYIIKLSLDQNTFFGQRRLRAQAIGRKE